MGAAGGVPAVLGVEGGVVKAPGLPAEAEGVGALWGGRRRSRARARAKARKDKGPRERENKSEGEDRGRRATEDRETALADAARARESERAAAGNPRRGGAGGSLSSPISSRGVAQEYGMRPARRRWIAAAGARDRGAAGGEERSAPERGSRAIRLSLGAGQAASRPVPRPFPREEQPLLRCARSSRIGREERAPRAGEGDATGHTSSTPSRPIITEFLPTSPSWMECQGGGGGGGGEMAGDAGGCGAG